MGKRYSCFDSPSARFDAASDLARRETRRALDVLNFFSDILPYSYGWVYLPGEAAPIMSGAPVLRADGTLQVALAREGPFESFSLKKLKGAAFLQPALRRAHQLMRNESRSPLEDVLLASIAWAGRASVATTKEQSFLFFAIALETLVLPEADPQELTYRLRVRAAHLLERDRRNRLELSSAVGKLYKVRSKIVHSGSYEVSEGDLGKLRAIAKRAILRVLLHPQLRRLTKEQELADWFEARVLQ